MLNMYELCSGQVSETYFKAIYVVHSTKTVNSNNIYVYIGCHRKVNILGGHSREQKDVYVNVSYSGRFRRKCYFTAQFETVDRKKILHCF
jgi:hypothetical protein